MESLGQGQAGQGQAGQALDPGQALHTVAAALAPLRASGNPQGLARAVCDLLVATMAVACRIDVAGEGMPPGLVPPDGAVVRAVRPGRPDLAAPSDDCGDPAGAARAAVSVEPDHARDLSWITVPIVGERRILGTLRVAVAGAVPLPPAIREDIGHIGDSVASALVEAARGHEAVQVSRSLQESLLPHSLPRAPWFEVAARYEPATATLQVGGDWYDAQLLRPDELALSVGDVAGHGVEAAARMGELRAAMTAMRLVCEGPHELIGLMHRLYDGSPTFATAICARLDPRGLFRWSSAGHLHPVVARPGAATAQLEGRVTPPLGAGVTGSAVLNERHLRPGDTVLLYTDGLVERREEPLDESLSRLVSEVSDAPSLEPDRLLDHVVSCRQTSGPTADDIAVVAARLLGWHRMAETP